jgi:hypothetical protein
MRTGSLLKTQVPTTTITWDYTEMLQISKAGRKRLFVSLIFHGFQIFQIRNRKTGLGNNFNQHVRPTSNFQKVSV